LQLRLLVAVQLLVAVGLAGPLLFDEPAFAFVFAVILSAAKNPRVSTHPNLSTFSTRIPSPNHPAPSSEKYCQPPHSETPLQTPTIAWQSSLPEPGKIETEIKRTPSSHQPKKQAKPFPLTNLAITPCYDEFAAVIFSKLLKINSLSMGMGEGVPPRQVLPDGPAPRGAGVPRLFYLVLPK
jgi:hypothetical protein